MDALHERLQSSSAAGTTAVLDVRTAWEFSRGHIPGALHIPLDTLSDAVRLFGAQQAEPAAAAWRVDLAPSVGGLRLAAAARLLGVSACSRVYSSLQWHTLSATCMQKLLHQRLCQRLYTIKACCLAEPMC